MSEPNVPVPPPDIDFGTAMLAAHNQHRAEAGVPPLRLNPQLHAAAQFHAERMAATGRMAHEGIRDGTPWHRIETAGYRYGAMGENVAAGFSDGPSVMAAWLASPGHRANILRQGYRDAGFGIARGADGTVYWCVDFAAPLSVGPTAHAADTQYPVGEGWLVPAARRTLAN